MMSPLKQRISKRILQYFDKGIVLSRSLKPLLQKFLADEKIFIRHNFIQNSLILPAEKVHKLKEFKQLRLVFMSNLIAEKGIEELLVALEFLNSKNGRNFISRLKNKIYIISEDINQLQLHKNYSKRNFLKLSIFGPFII